MRQKLERDDATNAGATTSSREKGEEIPWLLPSSPLQYSISSSHWLNPSGKTTRQEILANGVLYETEQSMGKLGPEERLAAVGQSLFSKNVKSFPYK